MESIVQECKYCYVCGTDYNLHQHHIFYGTSNRKNSEQEGLKVWLCGYHHNLSDEGVHFNKALDKELKVLAQKKYEETHTREDFMHKFGKNYIY